MLDQPISVWKFSLLTAHVEQVQGPASRVRVEVDGSFDELVHVGLDFNKPLVLPSCLILSKLQTHLDVVFEELGFHSVDDLR